MRVEIVSLTAAGNDGINVCFELSEGGNLCKESFLISIEAFTRLGICKGECDKELYDTVEREAEICAATRRGIYVLGFGACSGQMLTAKLREKGFSRECAAEAVRRIERQGYINEGDNAIREAEICAAKLWGESRIKAKLMERRYSREAIESALFALEDGGVDYEANCKALIDKRYRTLPTERGEVQRLVAAVSRYGYNIAQIKKACAELTEERKISDIYR